MIWRRKLSMLVWVVIRGMGVGLDGVLLGGQAEGVPAHRVQDVESAHPLVAADDVGGGVALGMADVQAGAARVREHVEDVELGPRRIEVDRAEGLVPLPFGLPLGLDALRMVRRHGSRSLARDHARQHVDRARAAGCSVDKKSPPRVRGAILAECPA